MDVQLSHKHPFLLLFFSLLYYWKLYFLITFLLKSLLSLCFSTDWNFYFLFSFQLKSLLSYQFSIEISTFLSIFYQISTFSSFLIFLKSLLSRIFSFWNLYFLFAFLLKSLLSPPLSLEIATLSLLYTQRCGLHLLSSLSHYARETFKEKMRTAFHEALRPTLAFPNVTTHTKFRCNSYSQRAMQHCARKPRGTRAATAVSNH